MRFLRAALRRQASWAPRGSSGEGGLPAGRVFLGAEGPPGEAGRSHVGLQGSHHTPVGIGLHEGGQGLLILPDRQRPELPAPWAGQQRVAEEAGGPLQLPLDLAGEPQEPGDGPVGLQGKRREPCCILAPFGRGLQRPKGEGWHGALQAILTVRVPHHPVLCTVMGEPARSLLSLAFLAALILQWHNDPASRRWPRSSAGCRRWR